MSHRLAVAAVLVLALERDSRGANLITNGSFATGTSGWTQAPTTPPAFVHKGWQCGGFVQINADCTSPPSTTGWKQSVQISPHQRYVLLFRATSSDRASDAVLAYTNESSGVVSVLVSNIGGAETGWRLFLKGLRACRPTSAGRSRRSRTTTPARRRAAHRSS